jgi:uncharacterized protein YbjQ (UPF0145 family)
MRKPREPRSDRPVDADSERKPDAARERTPEAAQERTPDAVHEQAPDAVHEQAPDAAHQAPGNAAEQISEAEMQESLERVERGGIPLGAERRLRELGEHGGAFTSDLSVADFALCHQLGLAPLSQVMGSSIYQVGWQNTPWPITAGGFMFELSPISDAWNEVRRRALNRLAQEATHVGADAVVGVDIRTSAHDWAENSIEYVVIGTAVRGTRGAQPTPGGAESPVITELAVADYSKLMQAGLAPLGVVAWSSAFFVRASYATQMMGGLGGTIGFTQNQELPEFTEGIYAARETVMQRMTAQATQLGATGVIGARINHSVQRLETGSGRYAQGGLMVTFHAIGTAIREHEQASLHPPETILDLTT